VCQHGLYDCSVYGLDAVPSDSASKPSAARSSFQQLPTTHDITAVLERLDVRRLLLDDNTPLFEYHDTDLAIIHSDFGKIDLYVNCKILFTYLFLSGHGFTMFL